jgi:hypothetical protein
LRKDALRQQLPQHRPVVAAIHARDGYRQLVVAELLGEHADGVGEAIRQQEECCCVSFCIG